jgi:hypothetical protein
MRSGYGKLHRVEKHPDHLILSNRKLLDPVRMPHFGFVKDRRLTNVIFHSHAKLASHSEHENVTICHYRSTNVTFARSPDSHLRYFCQSWNGGDDWNNSVIFERVEGKHLIFGISNVKQRCWANIDTSQRPPRPPKISKSVIILVNKPIRVTSRHRIHRKSKSTCERKLQPRPFWESERVHPALPEKIRNYAHCSTEIEPPTSQLVPTQTIRFFGYGGGSITISCLPKRPVSSGITGARERPPATPRQNGLALSAKKEPVRRTRKDLTRPSAT